MRRRAAATFALVMTMGGPAMAQETPAPAAAPTPTPRSADEPRALPDYDGRGKSPTTFGDVALWVPRVLFSPLYFVSEYVIRRPLGWLIATAEQKQWPSAIFDFFTFDKERTTGLLPTAFVDFGFRPSVGLYFFANDTFAKGNDLKLFATTWGSDWLSLSAADRVHFWRREAPASAGGGVLSEGSGQLRVSYLRRPDYLFHGFGPTSRPEDAGRYAQRRVDVAPSFDLLPMRALRIRTEAGARFFHYEEDSCCDDPSVVTRAAQGAYPVPPGLARNYSIGYGRAELIVDTRPRRPRPQHGVRLMTHAEHDTNLRGEPGSWIKYGGAVGGFVDLTGTERVVGLTLEADFVDPVAGAPPPFSEQVVLGGTGMLRGFRPGRLHGRSGAAATLSYEWPIWAFLSGTAHGALGNAWGPGLRGFDPELLRLSSGIGIRTRSSPDHQFEILAGFGTEPIGRNFEVSQFRLVFGATRGF